MAKYKTIAFFGKTADRFGGDFIDNEGIAHEFDGYPPAFLGYDGISLEIDLETGQILNWKAPTDEQIENYLNE